MSESSARLLEETAVSEHSNISLLHKIYARDRDTFFRMVTRIDSQ